MAADVASASQATMKLENAWNIKDPLDLPPDLTLF